VAASRGVGVNGDLLLMGGEKQCLAKLWFVQIVFEALVGCGGEAMRMGNICVLGS
jgi:hypothetical protein